ncbi:4-amino-4-deoxy-L-arabinose-phosphoundecaprenol flippase subunit ArnE [Paenibacillus konkukensis]|uniref:4-amino-4-deoxy-L-arabinose-phosphoundecaprenol flippase subunit ArnE n=1 Tax=Paenibacillus konkukensis TaxID=2020716 RepID=A0ABY4RJX3_9BACL|nr:EamA family transporter [Paenibacillus konkukensis]UQZ82764.1 4-amino-4-deoxy-L-arabinose-phosphoundecaprenol flippase subunit ArnE [Paenibacillus konkukensis]
MWFVFAAASAVCFGLRGILYQWTSQRPIDRNLLLLGVYLSGTIIAFAVNAFVRQPWSSGCWVGVWMGLFSFISNASMYRGFAVGRASVIAMFTGLPPVVVVTLAYLLWGERLNMWQTCSFAVIVLGILMIRYSNDISLRNLQGAGWGALTMIAFGITDLSSKKATMLGAETLPTLMLMYVTGTVLFGAAWYAGRRKLAAARAIAAASSEVRQSVAEAAAGKASPAAWTAPRTLLWGMVVGLTNISGMMLVMPAFKLGVTGLVSVVIAMNVVFVLLYARFVLKERFTKLEAGGLTCALIGIIILRLAA